MSSLLASYTRVTQLSTLIRSVDEQLLTSGRVYQMSINDIAFGIGVVVDFVIQAGTDLLVTKEIDLQSTSDEFEIKFFGNTDYSGGTPIPLVQQAVGNPRPALATAFINPTINDTGPAGTSSVVRGISGQGNQSGLSEGQRESLSSAIPNLAVLMRVTNRGDAGVLDMSATFGEVPV